MITVDWPMFGFGALAGAIAAALFFAGLAWGMRIALRQAHPTPVLLLSGAIRIAALLFIGWVIAAQGVSALAGFAIAFLLVRFVILAWARPRAPREATPWN